MIETIKPTNTEPTPATVALMAEMDNFMQDYFEEVRRQSTKANSASERRMRKLLREFNQRIYVPYRDASLGRDN